MLIAAACLALTACLASLFGLWIGFGRASVLIRTGVSITVLVLGAFLWVSLGQMEAEWVVLITLTTSFVAASAGMLRLLGVQLMQESDRANLASTPDKQFSMLQMMAVATMIACLFAVFQACRAEISPTTLLFGAGVALCFAIVANVILWSVMPASKQATRVIVACLVVLTVGCVVYWAMEVSDIDPGSVWFSIVVFYAVMFAGGFKFARKRGYQLASRHDAGLPDEISGAEL